MSALEKLLQPALEGSADFDVALARLKRELAEPSDALREALREITPGSTADET